MSWGLVTHGLAGSPVAHAWPLTLGDRPGEFPAGGLEWPDDNRRDKDLGPGAGPRRQGTRTTYQHDWFLGDRTPGGGIDLRACGRAPLCVCTTYPAV